MTVAIGLVFILLFGIAPRCTIRTWRRLCGGIVLVVHVGGSIAAVVINNNNLTPLALVCWHSFRLILAMPLFLHWAVPLAMTIVSMGTVPAFLLIKHNASVADITAATLQTTAVGLVIMHHMYYRDAAIVRTATDTAHKRHLLARVAHDFGTPLTAVKTLAYALPRGTPGRGQLRLFIEQLEMLRSMIVQEGQLMAGATLQPTNRPIADFEAEVVDFSVNVARLSANRRDPVDIRVETAPQIRGSIVSDVCWLRCALFNLITNSVKFTTSRILVCTTLVRGGTMLRVEVHDDGRGIDDADAARLFQMYSQLQDDAGGSGIGLKSTFELVHDLGGTCKVIGHGSRFFGGACFRLDIPYTPVHVVPATTLSIAPAVEEKKNDNDAELFPDDYGNGCSVLFVEDTTMLCKMGVRMFKKKGFTVEAAANGEEGLRKLQQRAFDVVFTDINMPEKDGFEFLADFRVWERDTDAGRARVAAHAPQRFVATSASAATARIDREFDESCPKPYDWPQMWRTARGE